MTTACIRLSSTSLALALILVVALSLLSCGNGGGGSVSVDPSGHGTGVSDANANKTVGQAISEDEIGTLPAWQQEMFSDSGWNQPFIAPREQTPIEAPSYELLMAETQKALEKGMEIQPRGLSDKSVSWDDQKTYVAPTPVMQGEYKSVAPGAHAELRLQQQRQQLGQRARGGRCDFRRADGRAAAHQLG